ncbi:type II toxin-antitoxin system YoeB family toxin [Candidatus Odyssella thessalonicensis]|uniref:type II toxin-antitoxin system YoeB family toxin n=1 Tax=Candidatus Odyssella thessalonicensis TaxID=84647 RepID=UPI000527FBCE|nr:type II toxin-antitoxin system YoeB family toxin [Candidatus Odyssella thessalonicensis]
MTKLNITCFLTVLLKLSSTLSSAMQHDDLPPHVNRSLVTIRSESFSPELMNLSSLGFLQATSSGLEIKPEIEPNVINGLIRQGLVCYQSKELEKAKDYFLQGAQAGSAQSMCWYGTILKDQGQIEESFYWQRLALITSLLTGKLLPLSLNKLRDLAAAPACPEPISVYVNQILKTDFQKLTLSPGFEERMTVIANTLLLPEKDCLFYLPLMEQLYDGLATLTETPSIHLKVRLFLFFRCNWLGQDSASFYSNKAQEHIIKAGDLAKQAREYEEAAHSIEKKFIEMLKQPNLASGYATAKINWFASILRKSKNPLNMGRLGGLIADGFISEDEDNNPISENKRLQVAARLWRVSHLPIYLSVLGQSIASFQIHEDENGNSFPEEQRYEIAARLLRLHLGPQELEMLAKLILTKKIDSDEKGQPFIESQRYEVVARLCRQSRTPDALNLLAQLIWKGSVLHDEKDKAFSPEKRQEVTYRLLRNSGTQDSLYFLGEFIEDNLIHKDEKGRPVPASKRYEVAARLYRLSGVPEALNNLARLIFAGLISKDENNRPLSEAQRYEEAARLFRQAGDDWALCSLAKLIEGGFIHADENGKPIPEEKRYQEAARLYRQVEDSRAAEGLARLVRDRKISEDENLNPITQENLLQVIARLLKKAGTPEALYNLASMIMHNHTHYSHIHEDGSDELIAEEEQDVIATDLLKSTGLPEAYYFLALLKLNRETTTVEDKQAALEYALLAARGGSKRGEELYEILAAELKGEEALPDSSVLVQDKAEAKTAASSEAEAAASSEAEAEIISLEKRMELKRQKKLQRPKGPKKLTSRERKDIFKNLVKGQLTKAERHEVLTVLPEELKPKIIVRFSKRAAKDLDQLPPQEKKKVFRLIRDLREEIPGAHQKPLRQTKEKSRRITKKDRLVYYHENNVIKVKSCKGHYDD